MRYHGRMSRVPPETHGMALREAKVALRTRVLAARDALPDAQRAAAARVITGRLIGLPSFDAARTALLSLAFRSEWQTTGLVEEALARGKEVALPRVETVARMLALHAVRDLATDIEPGYRGIPEPRPTCPLVDPAALDWILVPGVAFDRQGRRLGYGGGFYDRLLPLVPARVPRIAAAYDMQVVDAVPSAPHDATVDALITEREALFFPRERAA